MPGAVPGLMAYMVSIIRVSQEYEGAGWVAYEAAFRRQAAATGQRDWSGFNTSLYTICFTGKAHKSQRCDNCLSAAHRMVDCYALGEEVVDVNGRVKAMETALLTLSQGALSRKRGQLTSAGFLTRSAATFAAHACRWCGGAHPGCECRQASRPEQGPGPIRHEHPRRPLNLVASTEGRNCKLLLVYDSGFLVCAFVVVLFLMRSCLVQ